MTEELQPINGAKRGSFDFVKAAVHASSPLQFSIVLATAAVSIAAHQVEFRVVAHAFLWLNAALYAIVFGLNGVRSIVHHREFIKDLNEYERASTLFLFLSASSLLITQFLMILGYRLEILIIGVALVVLWACLTPVTFRAISRSRITQSVEQIKIEHWFPPLIAAQAIAVSVLIASDNWNMAFKSKIVFVGLLMWLGARCCRCGGSLRRKKALAV